MSPGSVRDGGVVSFTVTVNVPVPVFPALFVAVQVTIVAVIAKVEPEAGVQVGPEVTPTASVAVHLVASLPQETVAPLGPVASTPVMSGPQLTLGGVVSAVTVNLKKYFASYTRITDRSMEILAGLPALEVIEFYACARVTDAGVAMLARSPSLRELRVSGPRLTRACTEGFPPHVKVEYTV